MPVYEYRCETCGKIFTTYLSLADHSKREIACPACGSKAVEQQFAGFFAKTESKT